MGDNRYVATPHRNGTWTVVDIATGEDVEASGIVMLFLTEALADVLAEMLNTDPLSGDPKDQRYASSPRSNSVIYGHFQSKKG